MNITRYVLVGLDDELETRLYDFYEEALADARERKEPVAIVEYTFEYTDSELV